MEHTERDTIRQYTLTLQRSHQQVFYFWDRLLYFSDNFALDLSKLETHQVAIRSDLHF